MAGNVFEEPLPGLEDFLRVLQPSPIVVHVPKDVDRDERQCLFQQIRVLHVEVLQYFEGQRARLLVSRLCAEDFLKGQDDEGEDELVLLVDEVLVLLVLLAEEPPVDSLGGRDLLLFEEPDHGFDQ